MEDKAGKKDAADKPDVGLTTTTTVPSSSSNTTGGDAGVGAVTYPSPHHQTTVSWGEHYPPSVFHHSLDSSSPVRNNNNDVYSEDSFVGIGGTSLSPFPSSLSHQDQRSPKRSDRIVNVNDILKVNPLESEAETLIIKAIEKQEAIQQRSRANTGNTSILQNIPAESIEVFASSSIELERGGNDNESHSTTNPARFSAGDRRIKNKINQPTAQRPPRPAMIKRNQTTEQTLAALTMAMENFQDHHHTTGNENADDMDTPIHTTFHSAAEAFAQNANVVFRGKHKSMRKITENTSEDSSNNNNESTSPTKAVHHWGKLRHAVQTPAMQAEEKVKKAANNWGKLRTAVKTVNFMEQQSTSDSVEGHKKTDDGDDQEVDATSDNDVECGAPATNCSNNTNGDSFHKGKGRKNHLTTMAVSKGAVHDFQLFVGQRRRSFLIYVRFLLFLVFPATAVSFILFYLTGNQPTGKIDLEASSNGRLVNTHGNEVSPNAASTSWWILFICVRQALTFSLAQLIQVFTIDFLCLNTKFFKTLFGNLITLLIAQSKGWPFIATTWGLLNFALLHGPSKFASSWLYWQEVIEIFNEVNPGGAVTSNIWNTRVLLVAVSVGIVVSLKRLWLGLFLGKKTFSNHAEDLTNVVKKAILLCEVATLARDFQLDWTGGGMLLSAPPASQLKLTKEELGVILSKSEHVDSDHIDRGNDQDDDSYHGGMIIDTNGRDLQRSHLNQSQRVRISELLGAWEEPEAEAGTEENITISGILQFRNSLSILDNSYTFGIAWGDVSTRARMVVSSQEVYKRLMLRSADPNVLKFDVLAQIALEQDEKSLNQEKLEDIIRLLRPDRDGNLSLLEFVKSVDAVYKEAKLLRASVKNSEHIDHAFENAINVVFYTVMTCIILSRIGIDPIALFLSLSGLILAFAFMIGSASAKMFEGFLFILIRRPYNIGDRIHISNVEADTDPTGSAGWIVKDVTLFHTTAVYAATGERATMANGSLSSSRVINMARSPKASIFIQLKFSIDTPFERIEIFEQSLREFVKARPREWANFNAFRAGTIYADLGYIEYGIALTHREAWQNIGAILNSKAEVNSFCLELSKKLKMGCTSPTLPVDLTFVKRSGNDRQTNEAENSGLAAKFMGMARDDASVDGDDAGDGI